jgi:hypothetical protein
MDEWKRKDGPYLPEDLPSFQSLSGPQHLHKLFPPQCHKSTWSILNGTLSHDSPLPKRSSLQLAGDRDTPGAVGVGMGDQC